MYMHGAAVVGRRLYVIGGRVQREGWSKLVFHAEIQAEGKLGPWKEERSLPEFRAYIGNSVEVVNDRIYVVAGSIPPSANVPDDSETKHADNVLWSRLGPDGALSEWKHSTPYPGTPVTCAATCSSDKQLFVLGGLDMKSSSDRVLVADFAPDGAPVNWREARKLPLALSFPQAALLEDRIYVWGGLPTGKNQRPNGMTYSATVDSNGQIGEWQKEQALPFPFYAAAFCGLNDYLVAIGGRYTGSVPSSDIWYNHLDNEKTTQWQPLKSDLELAVYRAIGFDKAHGVVYVTGGLHKNLTGGGPGTGSEMVSAFKLPESAGPALAVGQGSAQAKLFASLPEALRQSAAARKQALVFFYSPEVPACKRLWTTLLASPVFGEFAKPYVCAAVDITKMDSADYYRLNVFKVPALVLFGSDGQVIGRTLHPRTMDDVTALPKGGR